MLSLTQPNPIDHNSWPISSEHQHQHQKTSKINGIRVGWIEPEQQYLGLMNPVEVKYWSENDQSYYQTKMELSPQGRLQFQNQNLTKDQALIKDYQSYCQSKMESSTQDRLQFQNQNPPKTENKVKRH
nr:hypothetical protein [Endozoicomonas sp.]